MADPLRKPPASCFPIPLLKGLVRDLALDEELRKLASLGLTLEWHPLSSARYEIQFTTWAMRNRGLTIFSLRASRINGDQFGQRRNHGAPTLVLTGRT
jgi:hypothetical protein